MHKVNQIRSIIYFSCINFITGIIKQLGVTGVAMLTLVSAPVTSILNQSLKESLTPHKLIAIYTFLGVWLGKAIKSIRVTWGLLMIVWSFIALMTILGNVINRDKGKSHYLSPVPVRFSGV